MNYFSENWMSYLDDNKKLTELTIPGTHDTCAYRVNGFAQCQTMNLETQFKSGVRFWDIRLKIKKGKIYAYHGIKGLDITFQNILESSTILIQQFPSECIVMSISHEQNENNKELYNKLWPIIKDLDHWYKEDRIPKISEVRGKIVLFRRFRAEAKLSFPVGINAYGYDGDDVSKWPKDRISNFEIDGINFYVQDRFDDWKGREDIENKFKEAVKPTLEKASSSLPNTLFINFTSGTSGNLLWENPKDIAEIVNPLFFEYLFCKQKTRYGIIPMDFPETTLIKRLFSCNPFNFPSIKPGNIYEIRSRLDLDKCLDVSGNIKTDGTQVIVHTANNQSNQLWKLADAGDGYFYIHTLTQNATDSVLDVAGNTDANGTNIIIQKQNNGNNQKWKIAKLNNGYFTLEPKNAPNSLLDLFEAKTEDGSPVKIFAKSNDDWAEQWALIPIK
ncbi:phosphatidylinositol-specific phospholipase C domain-containing protein [Flavobacterium flavigenum]|uniref:phosphatidylinositol-specific phospholipase C domain-containing protein n=1 Tax=Flavobacterium flavigenum TaxID=3003258 RepID=UPI002482CC62|nr:phosphatidylinositol-specific phospholipase C domain-containing protein [Flavobacterium flavigenum]